MRLQKVKLVTDCHDVDGTRDEQWFTVQSAGAFLLSQWMPDKAPPGFPQAEYEVLKESLFRFCKALGFSKWDFRSEWYVSEVLPLGVDPPESELPQGHSINHLEIENMAMGVKTEK